MVQKPQAYLAQAESSEGQIMGLFGNAIQVQFCETLGHENTLIIESNRGPKVGFWADFCFLPPDRNE